MHHGFVLFGLQVAAKFQLISDMIAGKPYEQHVVSKYYAIENSSNDQEDQEVLLMLKSRNMTKTKVLWVWYNLKDEKMNILCQSIGVFK